MVQDAIAALMEVSSLATSASTLGTVGGFFFADLAAKGSSPAKIQKRRFFKSNTRAFSNRQMNLQMALSLKQCAPIILVCGVPTDRAIVTARK